MIEGQNSVRTYLRACVQLSRRQIVLGDKLIAVVECDRFARSCD